MAGHGSPVDRALGSGETEFMGSNPGNDEVVVSDGFFPLPSSSSSSSSLSSPWFHSVGGVSRVVPL